MPRRDCILINHTFRSRPKLGGFRKVSNMNSRISGNQRIWLRPHVGHHRACVHDATVRNSHTLQNHRARTNHREITDDDWRAGLPRCNWLYAMRQKLGARAGNAGELSQLDSIRAIDIVLMRDHTALTQHQFRPPAELLCEESRIQSSRKPQYPVEITDDRLFIHLEPVKPADIVEMADRCSPSHLQLFGKNNGHADTSRRVDGKSKSPAQHPAAKPPWEKETNDLNDKLLHLIRAVNQ